MDEKIKTIKLKNIPKWEPDKFETLERVLLFVREQLKKYPKLDGSIGCDIA